MLRIIVASIIQLINVIKVDEEFKTNSELTVPNLVNRGWRQSSLKPV